MASRSKPQSKSLVKSQARFQATKTYRIVSDKFPVFDGAGAFKWGSRWVAPGRHVVHAASQYSLAVLENLVHWNTVQLPPTLVCVVASIPDSISQTSISPRKLDDQERLRKLGNAWYDKGEYAVLWVPSVLSPYERNLLINQNHPDFGKIKVSKAKSIIIDSRLLNPK